MDDETSQPTCAPFYVKDCALAAMAVGSKAQTLAELRDRMKAISAESIYYHFWRQSIEASLAIGSFHNDFSNWAHDQLHDDVLAERLALMDPSEYRNVEDLRSDILEVIENRLDEQSSTGFYAQAHAAFHFIQSKIIVFNTPYKMESPKELVKTLPILSPSSIFYHFIDARRRNVVGQDDFSIWLSSYQNRYLPLITCLKSVDPYFIPLIQLQQKLSSILTGYFSKETDQGGQK